MASPRSEEQAHPIEHQPLPADRRSIPLEITMEQTLSEDDGSSVLSEAEADPANSADRRRSTSSASSARKQARRQLLLQTLQSSGSSSLTDAATRTAIAAYPMSLRKQLAMVKQMEAPAHSSPSTVSASNPAGGDPIKSPGGSGAASPLGSGTKKRLARVHRRNDRGETPLHLAARKGNFRECQRLLADGAHVDDADNAGWTALHEACSKRRVRCARVLIAGGANVNARSSDNETPLHDAASNGDEKLVRLLLYHGADRTKTNKEGKTPLDGCPPAAVEVAALLRSDRPPSAPPPESPPGSPTAETGLNFGSTDVNCPISIAISSPISSTITTADPSPAILPFVDSPFQPLSSSVHSADPSPTPSETTTTLIVQAAAVVLQRSMNDEEHEESEKAMGTPTESREPHQSAVKEEGELSTEEDVMQLKMEEDEEEEDDERHGNLTIKEEDEDEKEPVKSEALPSPVVSIVPTVDLPTREERSRSERPPERLRPSELLKQTAIAFSDGEETMGVPAKKKRSTVDTVVEMVARVTGDARQSKTAGHSSTVPVEQKRKRGCRKAAKSVTPPPAASVASTMAHSASAATVAAISTATDVYEFHSSSESDQISVAPSKERRLDEGTNTPNRDQEMMDEDESRSSFEADEADENGEETMDSAAPIEQLTTVDLANAVPASGLQGQSLTAPTRKVPPLRISLTKTPSEDENSNGLTELPVVGPGPSTADSERPRSVSMAGGRPARMGSGRRKNSSEEGSTSGPTATKTQEHRMTRSRVRQQGGSKHVHGDHGAHVGKRKGGWNKRPLMNSRFTGAGGARQTIGDSTASANEMEELHRSAPGLLNDGGNAPPAAVGIPTMAGGRPGAPAYARPPQPVPSALMYKNAYEGYRGLRQMIEKRWVKSMRESPAHISAAPANYADYLINTKQYLQQEANDLSAETEMLTSVRRLSEPLRVLYSDQKKRRNRLRTEHRSQLERLQLFIEKEYLRCRSRAANEGVEPMTAVRVIRDAEIYSPLTLDRPRRTNRRIEFGPEQEADLLAKFDRKIRTLRNQQRMEADSLYAEQNSEWQSSMKQMHSVELLPRNENDQKMKIEQMSAELSALAYAKTVLHALKYPHCGVMGILLGDRKDDVTRVLDAVPVRHELTPLAMSVEVALAHIDVHCQQQATQALSIVGAYFANESFMDMSVDNFVVKVADKITVTFPSAVIIQLNNTSISIDSSPAMSCCKGYMQENKSWKTCKLQIENEENTLAAVSKAIQDKFYREMMDFENHMDDPGCDFWNLRLNQRIQQLI